VKKVAAPVTRGEEKPAAIIYNLRKLLELKTRECEAVAMRAADAEDEVHRLKGELASLQKPPVKKSVAKKGRSK